MRLFPVFYPILALCGALALGACGPATVVGAGAAVGVSAAQERGVGGALSDTQIRLEINQMLFETDQELYADVHLQVQEGRVLLSGSVPSQETRLEAVRIAWRASGVQEVINEMEVTGDQSLGSYTRDRWIETQLRSKLLTDKAVSSINISIETVNQSVYLIGIAKSEDEVERVVGHAKDIPYVRRVVNYLTLKDQAS